MAPKYLNNIQLYHFRTCPFCIKVQVAMKLMNIKIKCKNIHSDTKNKGELIAGGGKKQVPCLRIQEGENVRWLYESNDIIKFLKQQCS